MKNMGKLGLVTISDLKTIDLVELDLGADGQFVALVGDNGVGKSTVMEGIEVLFTGGQLPEGLIRHGKKEALVTAAFSAGYTVKRRIRKSAKGEQKAELVITDPSGAPVPSPSAVMKELFAGYMSPARLASMEGASLYKEVVKQLPVDVAALENEVNLSAALLSDVNAESRVLGKMDPPADERPEIPPFDMDSYDLKSEKVSTLRSISSDIDHKREQALRLNDQVTRLTLELTSIRGDIETLEGDIKELPELEDEVAGMKEARDKRAHAEHLLKAWEDYDAWNEKADAFQTKAQAADKEHRAATDKLRKELAGAVGPGEVTVDESREVYIAGSPWLNAAFSERLKAAAILQINSLPDGKIPLMFIEHGEAMNTEKRLDVAKAAIEAGATVIMEIMKEDVKELRIRSETAVDPKWAKGKPAPATTDAALEEYKTPTDKPKANLPSPPPPPPAPPKPESIYPSEKELGLF